MPPKVLSPAQSRAAWDAAQGKHPALRPNKYNAVRVTTEHGTFDSKHEARTVNDLFILQANGVVRDVRTDKRLLKYEFKISGVWIGTYCADCDFIAVIDFELQTFGGRRRFRAGERYVCDAKSAATRRARDFILRKNLMLACHGIELIEL